MATIYRNGQKFASTGSSTADKVILSSALHIGGGTQTNAEDAVHALSESGGASSLADLSNVDIKNPQDGDTLYYDSINFVWTSHPFTFTTTWANGTDEDITAMLEAYYNNEINIHDYWSVGDERIVSLSAMSATGVGESHVAQDVTMVLMNEGGKTLTTPINGHTKCAFIVGQKNCLISKSSGGGITEENGYINSSNSNSGGWDQCKRRTWCNSVYKNALPSTLVEIFKEHQNITGNGPGSTTTISNDYFALPSEKEVFGSVKYANSTAEADNSQFKYYETSNNRIKYKGDTSFSQYWWERSPYGSSYDSFCGVTNTPSQDATYASTTWGIAPFGVI